MLKITLIGCGATMPTPNRATASCAIQYNGKTILLDCGEGTQVAARRAGISLVKIHAVCLTHYHGDHIFGLPGLLQTMASLGRTAPVQLLGPEEGFAQTTALLLALTGPLPFELILRPLRCPEDPLELWDGLRLECCPPNHRVPCIGYRLTLPRAGCFMPQQAKALGVPQKQWGLLQHGTAVTLEDGRIIQPCQVLGQSRPGLSVVYATDTAPCDPLPRFAQNADLLLCDATYSGPEDLDKAQLYGHCTFAQCGQIAAQAHRLWLMHYGGALADPQPYLPNAQALFPRAEAGFDGKQLELNFLDR